MEQETRSKSRRRGRKAHTASPVRQPGYGQMRHPFKPQAVFSEDAIAAIHDTALKTLEELGLKVLLPEARQIFKAGGARVDGDMVFIGREIIDAALQSAPASMTLKAADPAKSQVYENGAMLFMAGAGCPNVSDSRRGRRPGDLEAFVETTKLQQHFDAIHMLGPSAEPQDVPVHLRHYAMMQAQMQWASKPMNVYARGRGQVEQSFEMIRLGLGLSEDAFTGNVWSFAVINSNSPRMLDRPMAQGLIDFARAGQMTIITPFCLAGAMAPITVAGALTLQHAEALGAVALAQLTRAGAPISYGGFSSNVDMKSGSPAFGTPEHAKMQIGAGQLARHVGLPWRSAAGAASNTPDAQGATENIMGLWGAMMSNATLTVHAAGWLEGGLTFGYEKFITDMEALQMVSEMCVKPGGSEADIGYDALKDVAPGGHFFATAHTMERYATEFYEPLVSDLSNFGTWAEAGSRTAADRATQVWEHSLRDYSQPETGKAVAEKLATFIEKATKNGGAAPLD